jgi:serine/threonine protein kinase
MSQIIKNYEIRHRLGEGGMGTVYYAVDRELHREVALKCLRPEVANNPTVMNRFRKEARAQAQLNHPNIAQIWEFFQFGSEHYMAMEFVNGPTLAKVLRERGRLPYEEAGSWAIQALRGLDHAHRQGIVHRDIKPANLMIDRASQVKVTDFGIARVRGASRDTREGMVVGTYEYISPEAAQGMEATAASDSYSIGVVLFEMITGRLPFESQSEFELLRMHIQASRPSVRSMVRDVPGAMDDIVKRAMDRRTEKRFRSAAEMADEIQTCLDSRQKRTPPSGIKRFFSLSGETPRENVTLFPPVTEHRRRPDVSSTCHRVEDLMEQQLFADADLILDSGLRNYPDEPDFIDLRTRLQRQRQQYEQAIAQQAELARDLVKRGFPEDALKVVGNALTMYPRATRLIELQNECRQQADLASVKAGELAGVQGRIDELIATGRFQQATDHVLELLGAHENQIELNKLLARILQARKDAEKQAAIRECMSQADGAAATGEWESALAALDGGLVRFPGDVRLQKQRQALHDRWQAELRRRAVEVAIAEARDLGISTSLMAARLRLTRDFDTLGRDPALAQAIERVDAAMEASRRDASIAKAIAVAAELGRERKWEDALDLLKQTETREGHDTRIDGLRATVAAELQARGALAARAASEARHNIQHLQWEDAVLRLSSALRELPGERVLTDLMQEAQRGLARKRRDETIARITSEAAERAQAGDYQEAIRLLLDAVSQYPDDDSLSATLSQTLFERDKRRSGVGQPSTDDLPPSKDTPEVGDIRESPEYEDSPLQAEEQTQVNSLKTAPEMEGQIGGPQDGLVGQQAQAAREQVELMLREAANLTTQHRFDDALNLLTSAAELDPKNAAVVNYLNEIAARRDRFQGVLHEAAAQHSDGNYAKALSALDSLSAEDVEASAACSLRSSIERDRAELERRDRARELAEAVTAVQGLITNDQLQSARLEIESLRARFPEEQKLEELLDYVRKSIAAANITRAIAAIRAEALGLIRNGHAIEARAVLQRGLLSYPDEAVLIALLDRVVERPAEPTREAPKPSPASATGQAPVRPGPTANGSQIKLQVIPTTLYIAATAALVFLVIIVGVSIRVWRKLPVVLAPQPDEVSFDVMAGSVDIPPQRVRLSDESIPIDAQADVPWVKATDARTNGAVLEVSIHPEGLSPGRHLGLVTVHALVAADRKVEGTNVIPVHLTVQAPREPSGPQGETATLGKVTAKSTPGASTRAIKAAIALGDFHYDRGEYDDAITEYRRGLEADPSNSVLQTKMRRAQRAKEAEQRLAQ